MTKHILDQVGNLIPVAAMQLAQHAPGKGVMVLDMRRRPILWVEETNDEVSIRVRDALIQVIRLKGRCPQPDWTELLKKSPAIKATANTGKAA
jgi:hypothetical protein